LVAEIGWLKKEKPEKMQLSEIEINEHRELGFEAGMRPVTKWGFFAMFAAAPRHFLFFFDFDFHGRQICSGVRAITKGLGFGSTALTPIIRPGFHVHDIRGSLWNDDRISHVFLLLFDKKMGCHEITIMGLLNISFK
jgi:hypothetical protein